MQEAGERWQVHLWTDDVRGVCEGKGREGEARRSWEEEIEEWDWECTHVLQVGISAHQYNSCD